MNSETSTTKTSDSDEEIYYIQYDCERRKVGCVLLQALGGTVPKGLFFKYFSNTKSWLLHPTPDLKLYPIKESQLELLAAKTDFEEKARG